jgi:hypothetical protein
MGPGWLPTKVFSVGCFGAEARAAERKGGGSGRPFVAPEGPAAPELAFVGTGAVALAGSSPSRTLLAAFSLVFCGVESAMATSVLSGVAAGPAASAGCSELPLVESCASAVSGSSRLKMRVNRLTRALFFVP